MSEEPNRIQQHEGPWRKLTPDRANSAREIHERFNGTTGEQRLDDRFGEGNWQLDTTQYDAERQLEIEATRGANQLASEGLKNVIQSNIQSDARDEPRKPSSDTYVDNDGNRLTGKVERRAAAPAMGDITISPDGDYHYQEKYGDLK